VTDPRQDPRPGPARPDYPPAERLGLVEQLHGFEVADPYRWLEDPTG
jgi:prolyl oligopeptidase